LHDLHPRDAAVRSSIEQALEEAFNVGAATLTIIHGHGKRHSGWRAPFANTNTGYLGLTVRGILRHRGDLRRYMLAKIDVRHDGSTTVTIRKKKPSPP
jgi:hypothetical protein